LLGLNTKSGTDVAKAPLPPPKKKKKKNATFSESPGAKDQAMYFFFLVIWCREKGSRPNTIKNSTSMAQ
jgi:hypothetical protein